MAQTRLATLPTASALLALLAFIPTLCLAQEKPDYSTPMGAANAFAQAVLAGDVAKAKAACTGDEKQMKIVEAMLASIGSIKQLESAINAKFGSEQVKAAGKAPLSSEDMQDAVKRLGEGEVKVTGDRALIRPQNRQGDLGAENPLPLRKVGSDWKVDLAEMQKQMQGGDAKQTQLSDAAVEGLQALASTVKGVTGDVNAGTYKTVAEAHEGTLKALVKMKEELTARQAKQKQPAKPEEKKPEEKKSR